MEPPAAVDHSDPLLDALPPPLAEDAASRKRAREIANPTATAWEAGTQKQGQTPPGVAADNIVIAVPGLEEGRRGVRPQPPASRPVPSPPHPWAPPVFFAPARAVACPLRSADHPGRDAFPVPMELAAGDAAAFPLLAALGIVGAGQRAAEW